MAHDPLSDTLTHRKKQQRSMLWIGPTLTALALVGFVMIVAFWSDRRISLNAERVYQMGARLDKHNLRLKILEAEVKDLRDDVEKLEPSGRVQEKR